MSQKFTTHLENFAAGEISPTWRGRVDTNLPTHGVESLENFYIMPTGGLRRREGTYIVTEALNSAAQSILVPYVHDPETTYVLEFSGETIRIVGTNTTENGTPTSPASSSGGGSSSGSTTIPAPDSVFTNSTFTTDLSGWTFGDFSAVDGDTGTADWDSADDGCVHMTAQGTFPGSHQVALLRQSPTITNLTAGVEYIFTLRMKSAAGYTDTLESGVGVMIFGVDSEGNNLITSQSVDQTTINTTFEDYTITHTPDDSLSNVVIALIVSSLDGTDVDMYISSIKLEPSHTVVTSFSGLEEADLPNLSFVQTPEGLFATGKSFPPHKLRYDGTDWTWTQIVLKDGPYFDEFDETYGSTTTNTKVSTTGGAVGASITVTFNAATLSTVSGDEVGRLIRIRPDTNSAWGYGTITAVASTTSCTVTVNATIASTTTSLEWRLGAWSQRTGYPRASCFHQQRHVFGGTDTQPQTVWGSNALDPEDFAPDDGSVDENITELTAYTFTLATREPELIQWLMSKSAMLIATNRQIHTVSGSANEALLSALNVSVNSLVKEGSAFLRPIEANDTLFFMQLYRRNLKELYYDTQRGRHVAKDLMIQADHLSDKYPIIAGGFQQYPYNLTFLSSDKGDIIGLTYNLDSGVRAWHRQILGGNFGGNNPLVESIIQVPGGTQDQIWMVVKRTIDGATKRTIEVFANAPLTNSTRTDTLFLDAGVKTTIIAGPAFQIDSIPGISTDSFLSHLEGETIGVVSNGVYLGTDTVTDGLPTTYTASTFTVGDKVDFGLLYTSSVLTNTIEPFNNLGNGPAKDQRIYEATFRVQNSLKGEAGYSAATALPFKYPSTIDPTNEDSETYTGDIKFKFPHGWDRDTQVYIQQDEPYPLTISMMLLKMVGGQA